MSDRRPGRSVSGALSGAHHLMIATAMRRLRRYNNVVAQGLAIPAHRVYEGVAVPEGWVYDGTYDAYMAPFVARRLGE